MLSVILIGFGWPPAAGAAAPVFIGAGDIGSCSGSRDRATGDIIRDHPSATVFTLGDNAYNDGRLWQFKQCYDPAWGSFKGRTRPSAGNHDYNTPGAAGYYDYFGSSVRGPSGKGWYSYMLGAWKIIVLNSNCDRVGGCGEGSAQHDWLRRELTSSGAQCTLAYWHHPRFSSGKRKGNDARMVPFWQALYDAGADVVLAGHDHLYERFAPQGPWGAYDPAHGIRQFTVGSGGIGLYGFASAKPNSQRRLTTFGVLRLTLNDGGYDWRFLKTDGGSGDDGSGSCHGRPKSSIG